VIAPTDLFRGFYGFPGMNANHLPRACFSSIILSPPNGNAKMSPHERKDIRVESESDKITLLRHTVTVVAEMCVGALCPW
jgi:hypothetical protein